MKEEMKSVLTAVGICAGCLAFWVGSSARNRVDVGSGALTAMNGTPVLSTWTASRDNSQVNVPPVDYYSQMASLLKKYYVEPVKDDDKLASGAIRGMIASLGDPESLYMESKDFQAYLDREKGAYQGIGVDLALQMTGKKGKSSQPGIQPAPADTEEAMATTSRFPKVIVVAVVPGSSADKAGVKVGDTVAYIDSRWVADDGLLNKFKQANRLFLAKKITFSQIEPLQKELRAKTERVLLPVRTLGKLMTGNSGTVSVVWGRNGGTRTTKLQKGTWSMPKFAVKGNTIQLPITQAAVAQLKQAIQGKSAVTLDLRYDSEGSYPAMLACLQTLAPSGRYGQISNQRQEEPTPLAVQAGNSHPPQITLMVGKSTRGPAEILALALSGQGRAKLVGQEMGGARYVKQDVELPDGSGYDLVLGTYRASNARGSAKKGSVAMLDSNGDPLKSGTAASMLGRENIVDGGVK